SFSAYAAAATEIATARLTPKASDNTRLRHRCGYGWAVERRSAPLDSQLEYPVDGDCSQHHQRKLGSHAVATEAERSRGDDRDQQEWHDQRHDRDPIAAQQDDASDRERNEQRVDDQAGIGPPVGACPEREIGDVIAVVVQLPDPPYARQHNPWHARPVPLGEVDRLVLDAVVQRDLAREPLARGPLRQTALVLKANLRAPESRLTIRRSGGECSVRGDQRELVHSDLVSNQPRR